jgi:hypothetical protein
MTRAMTRVALFLWLPLLIGGCQSAEPVSAPAFDQTRAIAIARAKIATLSNSSDTSRYEVEDVNRSSREWRIVFRDSKLKHVLGSNFTVVVHDDETTEIWKGS